jgi:phosphate transport system substrate-binding protein
MPKGSVMRRLFALPAVIALSIYALIGAQPAGAAVSYVTAQIDGSGSTWAQIAMETWISQVQSQNLAVVYTGSGSAQGRTDFRNRVTDFAVSDIGFQGTDPSTQTNDTSCLNIQPLSNCRPYVYLPIVAGGTAFPYQIKIGGQRVNNLRLSGKTLAKIFTGQITNWDNPEITQDNHGHAMPSLQIHPVYDTQGSGTSWQFTNYLATLFPQYWTHFNNGVAGATEYFPQKTGFVGEAGADSIINFVMSAAGNGSIGYDEYSYAKQNSWPVANVENQAGYFTAPTQYNVAVALTKAQINMQKSSPNYLLQTLNNVYTNPDPRTYPLSSYSYMIIPTSASDPRMGRTAVPKAQALALFIDHAVCGGQIQMGPIGYSPLPVNLAQASFEQMYKLHTADPKVQISQLNVATQCQNPTFWHGHLNGNFLAHIAPFPPSCDKAGQGPCSGSSGVGATGNPTHGKPPAPTGGSPTPTSSSSPASGSASSSASASASAGTGVPGGTTGGTGPGSTSGATLAGSATNIAASEGTSYGVLLAVLAGAEVLLLLALPPLIARRRQQGSSGGRQQWRIGR